MTATVKTPNQDLLPEMNLESTPHFVCQKMEAQLPCSAQENICKYF